MKTYMSGCNAAAGDVFDKWLSRAHLSDMGSRDNYDKDYIVLVEAKESGCDKRSGCCGFYYDNEESWEDITIDECKHDFQFLPRPGELWNVWSTGDGILHIQEYPLWLDGKVGNDYPVIEHKSEKKWYDPVSD